MTLAFAPLSEDIAQNENPSHKQRLASTPSHSVWVDASAGTGKTKVLTDRVLRFLLQGIAPSKILCLTFTKAAASEMQHRIFENLSKWSTCSRQTLITSLEDLLGHMPSPQESQKARRLFFQLIDDPYGLKVLTIHSFCQHLLARFPLEANLPIKASLIDQDDQSELLQEATDKLIAIIDQDPVYQQAFDSLTPFYKPQSLPVTLQAIILDPQSRRQLNSQSLETLKAILEAHFEMSLTKCPQDLIATYPLDHSALKVIHEACSAGTKTDQQQSVRAEVFIDTPLSLENFDDYLSLFFTQKGEPRKSFATQKILKERPWVQEFFHDTVEKLTLLKDQLNTLQGLQGSYALTVLSQKLLQLYESLKRGKSLLDFDDLISTSAQLLAKDQGVSWVLYKLDGGIDHILVDEAQDTSPDQWQIVLKLAEDFFAGETARLLNRTLFVVGDRKQSIYSFQGAEPDLFQHLRPYFKDKIENAKQSWSEVSLNVSFRSCQAVLSLVDHAFEALSLGDHFQGIHTSFRALDGGKVQLWPLVPHEKKEGLQHQASASQILATKIAQDIKERLTQKQILPAKGRPVKAGDFLILVQRRSAFMYQVIRALKRQNIPVAGPDRFRLMDHIASQDLLALANFLLLPEDDYTLACVLKSPLFNYSEQDLIDLSCGRNKKSLWASLCANQDHKTTRDTLSNLLKKVDNLTPYALFSYILITLKGRQKFHARLSDECEDVLDEFLNLAFHYGQGEKQSQQRGLQGFVEHCQKTNPDVKRDFSSAALNAVRIMTVHGAKGLQAPIVFLPDTTRIPNQHPLLLWQKTQTHSVPLWRMPVHLSCDKVTAVKEEAASQQLAEYYRLLYVALTRAEDELIIAGWETSRETSDLCWYHSVEPSLRQLGDQQENGAYCYECPQQRLIPLVAERAPKATITTYPEWLFQNPPSEIGEAEPLSPSVFVANKILKPSEAPLSLSPLNENDPVLDPYKSGNYAHKLLEVLPTLPKDQWAAYAKRQAHHHDFPHFQDLFESVMTLLENPAFTDVFGSNSYAEISVSGEVGGQKFNGQIDRLIITDKTLTIIDFKSNQAVPQSKEDVPESYSAQLGIYKDLLQQVYPHHTIECALIWVRTQQKMIL
ncbi:MAG TPA: double-strand break repair helicase AddA [Holosporales bacterium]|nr:double-strand break repair helicase AddA [Holosporales bacterium]